MLTEIRDIVEKRKALDGTADAPAAAPAIAPPTPDLQLPYNDRCAAAAEPDVLPVVHALLRKYSRSERAVCSMKVNSEAILSRQPQKRRLPSMIWLCSLHGTCCYRLGEVQAPRTGASACVAPP